MKKMRYFAKSALSIVSRWEEPEPTVTYEDQTQDGGEIPIMFHDNLARAFFLEDLARSLHAAYRRGVRDERKRNKRRAVRRWLSGRNNGKEVSHATVDRSDCDC